MSHPIPAGFHTITPHLVVAGASEAIEFYKRAFGAEERSRMPLPAEGGVVKIGHAELRIGDSHLFLADEFPDYGSVGPSGGRSPVTIHLYVTDADAAFARAVEAGATVAMPLQDMFWGDRYGKLVDPFGHHWSIAEHLEDVAPEQLRERMAAAMAEAPCE
ncbi:VOC family protein [Tautonia sociabilis]|uniref:VOC family protein n=1 Tax=Tautonia sociabilis TaxID=2080755 RepID=A0A432MIS2_9BACT|nr:VOC family protein [Tautonia sociabilis]RUL87098.1 VOC family protein [Tautonia sociabilis]